ncbi:TonB-dependent receptor [Sphingobium sp.]|uniref:TonB-dependent receptor n=1 Tax=Sphingobium sp. TaxID=1912891 RepID=UPI003B3A1E18
MSVASRIAVSTLALATGMFGASFAHAQATADQRGIEDIIVTAQKRSESLQKVPITVSAISAVTADALGIKDTTDLQFATPGLVMHHGGYSMTPTLRGIGTEAGSAGQESPIATYVDGVYLVSASSSIFSLSNIERVEVLKGPQGTLFGRNAVGGVINIITKQPSHTPEIKATAGYGNYDTAEAGLYATTGLTDAIAADVSVFWRHQYDGYGRVVAAPGQVNPAAGKPTFLSKEFAIRSKLLVTPGDSTDITIAMDYSDGENALGTARRLLPGTRAAANVIPNDVGPVGGFWDVRSDYYPQTAKYKAWGISGTIDHDFGWANVKSITAYRRPDVNSSGDQDSVEAPLFNAFTPTKLRQFSQELQLLSSDSSKVKWILGLYYLNADYDAEFQYIGSLFGPNRYDSFQIVDVHPTTKSLAGFGELTIPLGDSTRVTAGARYTYDKQHIDGQTLNNAGPVPRSQVDKSQSFSKPTWRLSIDHEFTPTLMAYASYNRGFKSGVYSSTAPTDPAVSPTTLDAYELGFKSQLFDNQVRFNASAFYYDIKDIQLTILNPGGGASLVLLNAAAGQVKGVDVDIEAVPLQNLTLRLGGEYLDTEYKDFKNAPVGVVNPNGGVIINRVDASGSDFVYAPKWTFNASALYDIPTQVGDFNLSVNYYKQSSFLGYFDSFRQSGYDLINASAGWTSSNGRWNVKFWGKNLANEKYYNHIAIGTRRAAGSPGAPRTYGITIGMNWGG